MQGFLNAVTGIANESGFVGIMENPGYLIMIIVACGLIYLAIGKQFEPLLLLPIAFGMLLANLPFGEIIHMQYFIPPEGADPSLYPMFSEILHHGGLADMLYLGVKLGIYPPLIFLGIGTMTDFGPLISNPHSLAFSLLTSERSCLVLPDRRPAPSASSAVRTARQPFSLPASWRLNCLALSLWPRTAIWRWCPSSSRLSCARLPQRKNV